MQQKDTASLLVRVKWCGKSTPRIWQQRRQGKPRSEQDQIGTVHHVFRMTVRVGRLRCFGNKASRGMIIDNKTRLIDHLAFFKTRFIYYSSYDVRYVA